MNWLQRKTQSLPPPVQVLAAGALGFVIFAAAKYVPPLIATGQMEAGPWDVISEVGPFALIMMAVVSMNLLTESRPAWRRLLLAVGMAGCMLMMVGYSFAFGYVVGAEGMPEGASAWNWFTIVFVFLVPVAVFVQGFRSYTRSLRNENF